MADDDFIIPPPVIQPEVLPPKPQKALSRSRQKQVDGLRAIEDRIYSDSLAILEEAMLGAEIDGDEKTMPEEWKQGRDERGAKRAFRVARDCRLPASVRPAYFTLAQQLVAGIAKAREGRGVVVAGPLQVAIFLGKEQASYEEISDDQEETE